MVPRLTLVALNPDSLRWIHKELYTETAVGRRTWAPRLCWLVILNPCEILLAAPVPPDMGVFLMLLLLLVPPLSLPLPLYLPPHLPPWLLLHCLHTRQIPHQELVALHPCHQQRGPLFEQVYLTATIVLLIAGNVRVGSCLQRLSLPGMRPLICCDQAKKSSALWITAVPCVTALLAERLTLAPRPSQRPFPCPASR